MQFRTLVHINPKQYPTLSYTNKLMSLGSCFSTHIGNKLKSGKFSCIVNPYGVLYNPASIAKALYEIDRGRLYTEEDLFYFNEQWHSWMHHGSFSSSNKDEALEQINKSLVEAHEKLKDLDVLFLTFGTAWLYELSEEEAIVSNCHKMPNTLFERKKMSVASIVKLYRDLLDYLLKSNPNLKVVFSVSPIRHIRDGMAANQLSKATLLLAIDELVNSYPNSVFYFPAYEIVLDELRDYRFYADDMVHPSNIAVEYIWERFREAFFSADVLRILSECEKIENSLNHRPSDPNALSYHSFLEDLIIKMEEMSINNPKLDFRKEIELCHIRLKR